MRNLKKAGDLETFPNIKIMPLDVTKPEQIRETCRKALAEYDIDVLLNNAGYEIMGFLRENSRSRDSQTL